MACTPHAEGYYLLRGGGALCLQRFFRMDMEAATRVMLHVHQKGVGVCGIFSYEVAETKVGQVMDFARQHQHPLQCTLEKA